MEKFIVPNPPLPTLTFSHKQVQLSSLGQEQLVGGVDCRPPIRVPYAFQELVQNNGTRFVANVSTGELEYQTEWAERLRNKQ